MKRREAGQSHIRGVFIPVFLFFLACVPAAVPQDPQVQPGVGPTMTLKQQREWLQWNHRRVQREIRRLTELAQELSAQAGKLGQAELTPSQREMLDVVTQQVIALNREFEKSNPHILSLSVVRYAEAIEEETKSFREALALPHPAGSAQGRLRHLCEQIEQRAKRVSDRLRQP